MNSGNLRKTLFNFQSGELSAGSFRIDEFVYPEFQIEWIDLRLSANLRTGGDGETQNENEAMHADYGRKG